MYNSGRDMLYGIIGLILCIALIIGGINLVTPAKEGASGESWRDKLAALIKGDDTDDKTDDTDDKTDQTDKVDQEQTNNSGNTGTDNSEGTGTDESDSDSTNTQPAYLSKKGLSDFTMFMQGAKFNGKSYQTIRLRLGRVEAGHTYKITWDIKGEVIEKHGAQYVFTSGDDANFRGIKAVNFSDNESDDIYSYAITRTYSQRRELDCNSLTFTARNTGELELYIAQYRSSTTVDEALENASNLTQEGFLKSVYLYDLG